MDSVDALPEESLGVFLLLARLALADAPCPSDEEIARALGSHSTRRGRSVLEYLEAQGYVGSDVGSMACAV